MTARRHARGRAAVAAVLGALAALAPGLLAAEDPAAELAEALRHLGAPGALWGRLAVEEESPDGPWTPLGGVEVDAYPATPSLLAELERIRESARGSGAEYESAVARFQAALAAHRAQIRAATGQVPAPTAPSAKPGAPAGPKPDSKPEPDAKATAKAGPRGKPPSGSPAKPGGKEAASGAPGMTPEEAARHRTTDSAGLFALEDLPAGDWLVVAIRITPYGASKGRAPVRTASPHRTQAFLPTPERTAKDAEIWLSRVRVPPGGRVALILTDRARWMAGPVYR